MRRLAWLGWVFVSLLALDSTAAAQVSEFRDAQYGFALVPPVFAEPAEGTAVVRLAVTAPVDAGFTPNINVAIQRTKTTRDAFVALSESQFKGAGLTIGSRADRTVSGRPAVLLDYGGPMNGRELRFLALAVILADRVVLLTCTAPKESFAKYEPEFRRSLESFRLTS